MGKGFASVKLQDKGVWLRAERRRRLWTQQHLADFAGVSLSTVERAERGEGISVETVRLLSEALGKTPEVLGYGDEQEEGDASRRSRPFVRGVLAPANIVSVVRLFTAVASAVEGV